MSDISRWQMWRARLYGEYAILQRGEHASISKQYKVLAKLTD
jgi:hypothetical protein